MNIIDEKIKELIKILEKQEYVIMEFETVGAVSIKFLLHKPKYTFLKTKECIKLCDKITMKTVLIDIYTAVDIKINKELQQYEIMLDNGQYIKMKCVSFGGSII